MGMRYIEDEIVLCTYAAMYDVSDFGGLQKIEAFSHRSRSSIIMKIKNIASMLDERNIPRLKSRITPLTGLPAGKIGRATDWDVVKMYCTLPQNEFLAKCKQI